VKKPATWVRLCQTDDSYWQAWEEGRGPGQRRQAQASATSAGLGDLVEAGLTKVGITKERYIAAKGAVGLKRRCNCDGRREMLNRLGKAVGIG
jgi:hypothetical protein